MSKTMEKHEEATEIPTEDLSVDFGKKQPGSSDPMPASIRKKYEKRIRSAVEAQSSGTASAAQIFIR